MSKIKLLTIVGARPQFIKAAMLSHALLDEKYQQKFEEIIVHTGQHYDANMSKIFFENLNIPKPKYQLAINNLTHGKMTGEMLIELEDIISNEQPNAVIVYGDTNSTLAGALVAAKLHIPVIHIEAGLRSFNKLMPEEINRVLTDHVSNLLFCPTQIAVTNLANEGITNHVFCTGDIMHDLVPVVQAHELDDNLLNELNITRNNFLLLTLHRAENTNKESLEQLLTYVSKFATDHKLKVVFPIHPRTRKSCIDHQVDLSNFIVIEPLGYFELQNLIKHANHVFTDSGGLQKEAYYHRVPCVTLRSETEWLETIEHGWNRLWQVAEYAARKDIKEYDNTTKVATKIIEIIATALG